LRDRHLEDSPLSAGWRILRTQKTYWIRKEQVGLPQTAIQFTEFMKYVNAAPRNPSIVLLAEKFKFPRQPHRKLSIFFWNCMYTTSDSVNTGSGLSATAKRISCVFSQTDWQ
jgi:hypothetical protein